MWNLIQDERYVSNPAKNKGRHTRGTAVDVTLVDQENNELAMPTEFDNMTEQAHSTYVGTSEIVRKHLSLLQEVMRAEGFELHPFEWWHFDYKGWNNDEQYPPLDIALTELSTAP
jgi:D-alanyl-D-alanine dipeptidase